MPITEGQVRELSESTEFLEFVRDGQQMRQRKLLPTRSTSISSFVTRFIRDMEG